MKRVLIMHISEFGGHKKASENISEAVKFIDPEVKTLNINGFGYLYPRSEKLVDFFYTATIKRIPRLWGKIYDRDSIIKAISPLKKISNTVGFNKFSHLLKDFKPAVIVATQAFPCGIAADFKKMRRLNIPIFAIVTDYYPHRFWINSSIDNYIVACKEAKDVLIAEGVDKEKIKVLGIPISHKFLETYTKEEVASELGFNSELPSILIMGGGLGLGPIKDTFLKINKIDYPFQVIVVCGRNKLLYNWFARRKNKFKRPVFYFGYINFVNKLMDFSDIIITKGGGITVSEALSKSMAIIVINPIPGQEERNVNYLLDKKAIVKADNIHEVKDIVKGLLNNPGGLISLKEAAHDISIRDSSLRIAYSIINCLG